MASDGPENMGDEPGPAHAFPTSYKDLLLADVTYDGWHKETAKLRSFYIRGYTWFSENILEPQSIVITDCRNYISRGLEILAERHEWHDSLFDGFKGDFAPNQLTSAVSLKKRKTISFVKAVQAIAVLEAMAEEKTDSNPLEIYAHIKVEPAVSYINDFDKNVMDTLQKREMLLDKLKVATGQESLTVFHDMIQGKTVTHKLAVAARTFIKEEARLYIGDVSYKFNSKKNSPSDNEAMN